MVGSVDLPPLTYLSIDPMRGSVGASQVVPYVTRLAERGLSVILHSFEEGPADEGTRRRLDAAGVRWRPHRFLPGGAAAGLGRVAQGAALIAGADLVHARSDMAAASCLVARRRHWVWDMRSFWREERLALGMMAAGSPQERVMASVEGAAARSSESIITLTRAAIDVLGERYGNAVAAKARVITTCVNLDRFVAAPPPPPDPLRLLLAGTINSRYDVATMIHLVERLRARRPTTLTVLTPGPTSWKEALGAVDARMGSADPSEMPGHLLDHHVGLCVLHDDPCNRGSAPIKVGEFLASGRPVVVNHGIGDLDSLLVENDCGVILESTGADSIDAAVSEIERLVDDDGTPDRCRRLAEAHFDLDRGIDQVVAVYEQAMG